MNLTSIINTIRTAVYGKDMREALAQGFEAIMGLTKKCSVLAVRFHSINRIRKNLSTVQQ